VVKESKRDQPVCYDTAGSARMTSFGMKYLLVPALDVWKVLTPGGASGVGDVYGEATNLQSQIAV